MTADHSRDLQEQMTRRNPAHEDVAPVHETATADVTVDQAPHVASHAAGSGRGNAGRMAAAIQRMQQTYGNRSTTRFLQRSAAAREADAGEDIGGRIRAQSGGGSALDPGVQRTLESGIGADLSGVRVHTDPEADHLSRAVNAVAFTTGSDIFFRSGAYNPGSSDGMHVLAHEATHTVQQAEGPVAGTPSAGGVSISDPSDSFEQAAEASASRVIHGGGEAPAAAGAGGAGAAVQREAEAAEQEDEEVQTMRMPGVAVQREAEAAEQEDEEVQTMRMPGVAVQREAEAAEQEDEQVQAMLMPGVAVQREEAAEDEEEEG